MEFVGLKNEVTTVNDVWPVAQPRLVTNRAKQLRLTTHGFTPLSRCRLRLPDSGETARHSDDKHLSSDHRYFHPSVSSEVEELSPFCKFRSRR